VTRPLIQMMEELAVIYDQDPYPPVARMEAGPRTRSRLRSERKTRKQDRALPRVGRLAKEEGAASVYGHTGTIEHWYTVSKQSGNERVLVHRYT